MESCVSGARSVMASPLDNRLVGRTLRSAGAFYHLSVTMAIAVLVSTRMQVPRLVRTESYWQGARKLAADFRWYAFLLGLFW